ncbi:cobalamin-binding protein [Mycobacterium sp. djl-10]|nr:cobalamin-binding protein [Mycobacterium sp. djl-10]
MWHTVLGGDEFGAVAVAFKALDDGADADQVLLDVIAAVQHKVGVEWAAGRITVAQEHTATAINERVVAAIAHRPADRPRPLGRITVACVDGEWHQLPARLLAEILRLRGWQVDFLGAQVPTPHLIAHLREHGPDAVALSSSIPTRLAAAHNAVIACQSVGQPVLAGGAAFGVDGRYARLFGADGWASDARAAAVLLADNDFGTPTVPFRQVIDDLPHLADQEYTAVSVHSAELTGTTMAALEDRWPALRDYTRLQRQHTTDDVGHIVEFLAAALYVDDQTLFSDFIAWTGEILMARGVPRASLLPALDILTTRLSEFPRACRILRAGQRILETTADHAVNA